MKDCPDRELLERLLTDRLDDGELDGLDEHVKACASCQQNLEELSDDASWRSALRHEVSLLFKDAEPEAVVDPLRVTAGARAAANEDTARVVPTVPGYEITGELGRGGMGVVYRARHIRLNRPCALKMILAGAHAGSDDVARFVTEAEAIARLEHPSIVQIRHIGDADGLPFLELEYLAGGSLDQQLDGTPWPAARAARIAEQVASGIAEAHRQGIVHRDLKPSNVLMAPTPRPRWATSAWPKCSTASPGSPGASR
jgi:serine/threonine protein kinase